jgi:hypothetical protein
MNHINAHHLIILGVSVLVAWGLVNVITPARKSTKVIDGFHPQPARRGPFHTIGVAAVVILLLWLLNESHLIPRLLNNGTAW